MTLRNHKPHFNVKFLKGYGCAINLKGNEVTLKNGLSPFSDSREIEHLDTFERDGKLFYKFKVTRSNRLRSSILSNKLSEIGKITEKTRQVDLNADKKRFWLESLTGINHKMNRSLPLSLNYFTKAEI